MTQTPTARTGANVRAEMARRGVSQIEMAEHLGIGQSGLSKRLRGVVAFDVNELATIAVVLDVTMEHLLEGVAA